MLFLNRADRIFLSFALFIVAIFSYLLYDDSLFFKDNTEHTQEQIGNILVSKNDVRLKNSSAFAWRSAGKSVEVHQKDSIFTGERSEVSIHLNDGSTINLKENSLVTLNQQNGEMTLDLKYGDFIGQLNPESKLKVTSGKEEYDLKGETSANNEKTVIQLNKSRAGQLDVKLKEGSAAVKSKNQTKVLEKDHSVSLAKNFEEVPRPSIKLLVADKSTFKQLKEGDELPFSWSASSKVPQFKIEISKNILFKELVWNNRTTLEKAEIPLRSGEGEFYWRVKALTASGQELNTSVTNSFKVARLETPLLLAPGKNQNLSFEMTADTPAEDLKSNFNLAWTATKDSKKFHYQIAIDNEFRTLIKDHVVEELEVLSPKVPTGQYFVRVRSERSEDTHSAWTDTHPVTINVTTEQRPPAPRLVKNKIIFNPATAEKRTPSSEVAPTLLWEKPDGIQHFKIQVGKTIDFRDAKFYSSNTDQFDLKNYTSGLSYFRVFSLGPRGLASLPSEVGTVSVSFLDPKIIPLKDLVVDGTDKTLPAPTKEMLVGWTPVPGAQKYLLEMAQNESFKNSKKFEVNNSTVPVILEKPGTYHVKVVALNQVGKIISHYSPPEKFQYIYRVPLALPSLLEPFDQTTVFLQQDTEAFIWLEWKTVKDVKVYQLDISASPSFETILLNTQTKEPRFLIKNKLPPGKLFWRVRAISENPDLSSDWTKTREFSILIKKNEAFQ